MNPRQFSLQVLINYLVCFFLKRMTSWAFGLCNWIQMELLKDEPGGKNNKTKQKPGLGAENQAKNKKEWPGKCGTKKANRVKYFS